MGLVHKTRKNKGQTYKEGSKRGGKILVPVCVLREIFHYGQNCNLVACTPLP